MMTSTPNFSKNRLLAFLLVLASLFALSTLYCDQLFDLSHQVILDEQARFGEDSIMKGFLQTLSSMTYDIHYDLIVLFLSPFMSRERFWYYMISLQVSNFAKTNTKMLISEPRPYWVWSDIFTESSCHASFGSPSGHATKSSNFALLIILDFFFAS